MTTKGFSISHLCTTKFESGLREFFDYRDLGIEEATDGRVVAHVIRAAKGAEFTGQPHLHRTDFQMVYISRAGSNSSMKARARCASKPAPACISRPRSGIVKSATARISKCSKS